MKKSYSSNREKNLSLYTEYKDLDKILRFDMKIKNAREKKTSMCTVLIVNLY